MGLGATGGFDILQMRIYCPDAPQEAHGRFPQSRHTQSLFKVFIAAKGVAEYMDNQCGKMIIAVCAGGRIRRDVEQAAPRPNIGEDLRLVNLCLEPAAEWTGDEISSRPRETTKNHHSVSSTSRPPEESSDTGRGSPSVTKNGASDHNNFVRQRIAEGRRV
ncbi:hypothetical protein N7461_006978 [Penicillium sp. DV-2018c]|nr:hypothetical protein N7461_006978 [Penicillium sp. DV-2018c]